MFNEKTPEQIKEEISSQLTLLDIREGSYTNDMISPIALELWKMYGSLKAIIPMVYVDETSGEYIDQKAANYGIKRKAGTKANARMHFTGNDGTLIPKGTIFLTVDGFEFETLNSVAIVKGMANVVVRAVEIGEIYNVPAGSITQQLVSISGLSGFTNEIALGGTNQESDKSLVERLYNYLQRPTSSGNIFHYEQWALEVNGVGGVKVIPLWNGSGTVKVLIVGQDKKPVDNIIETNCYKHIEQIRPIGADVTVISASGLKINVSASINIDSTTTIEEVEEVFKNNLAEYLQSIAFNKYEIIYNRIAYMLLDIKGVIDYNSLTINGGTSNITIEVDEVPIIGMVVIGG